MYQYEHMMHNTFQLCKTYLPSQIFYKSSEASCLTSYLLCHVGKPN